MSQRYIILSLSKKEMHYVEENPTADKQNVR
jgi:hypothetical protein